MPPRRQFPSIELKSTKGQPLLLCAQGGAAGLRGAAILPQPTAPLSTAKRTEWGKLRIEDQEFGDLPRRDLRRL